MKKNIARNVLVFVLCLLMLASLPACSGETLPLTEADVTVIPVKDLNYKPNEAGDGIILKRYLGSEENIGIPEKINGLPVVEIASGCFSSSTTVESVYIPDSVQVLGNGIFVDCTNLVRVRLPEGLTEIPLMTFDGCESLRRVDIPDSVTVIGNGAFDSCSSLKELTLPDSLESIGDSAFAECAVKELVIPDSVTTISDTAFILYEGTVKAPHDYSYYGMTDELYIPNWEII